MTAELREIELAGIGDEAAPELEGQIAAHRELGWSRIELRTLGGTQLGDLPVDEVAAAAEALDSAGLDVVCVSSRIGAWGRTTRTPLELDIRELEALASRAASLRCRRVRVMSFLRDGADDGTWRREAHRRLRELARRAEQLDVVLLHENCAGFAGRGPDETLDLLEHVDSPALRLLFDTGNGLTYGYDSLDFLAATLPFVDHVHVKDGVARAGGVDYVLPGAGDGRVVECLAMLVDAGYRGVWTIEPHLDVAPHRGELIAGATAAAAFVDYGRALERLIAERLVPVAAGPNGAKS